MLSFACFTCLLNFTPEWILCSTRLITFTIHIRMIKWWNMIFRRNTKTRTEQIPLFLRCALPTYTHTQCLKCTLTTEISNSNSNTHIFVVVRRFYPFHVPFIHSLSWLTRCSWETRAHLIHFTLHSLIDLGHLERARDKKGHPLKYTNIIIQAAAHVKINALTSKHLSTCLYVCVYSWEFYEFFPLICLFNAKQHFKCQYKNANPWKNAILLLRCSNFADVHCWCLVYHWHGCLSLFLVHNISGWFMINKEQQMMQVTTKRRFLHGKEFPLIWVFGWYFCMISCIFRLILGRKTEEAPNVWRYGTYGTP